MKAEFELCMEGSRVRLKKAWEELDRGTTGIVDGVDNSHCKVTFLSDEGRVQKTVPVNVLQIITQARRPKGKNE
jgi:hypothetical protein